MVVHLLMYHSSEPIRIQEFGLTSTQGNNMQSFSRWMKTASSWHGTWSEPPACYTIIGGDSFVAMGLPWTTAVYLLSIHAVNIECSSGKLPWIKEHICSNWKCWSLASSGQLAKSFSKCLWNLAIHVCQKGLHLYFRLLWANCQSPGRNGGVSAYFSHISIISEHMNTDRKTLTATLTLCPRNR